ncbi:MAG: ethyl tert-butyl ether degradation EthD [Novosphingobium sp. 28-62-57]|uniref:nuclear transport factor 2 family protein n=1 Tax=unclassified Novosphingobium TaxID=2644732 RepID=UPI000BC72AA5|nr:MULTISPECIES: nuclear transport factor 2 family protein [unclassified Novosphingobium]OYW51417.1 MAG: ethyl tert-butyl ether degradation EthD [Novosphingobium sp. 12-62-10]OYZ10447.1 MAG: ethyl tert-butyl ether degradation EthD [Novosphingobium sp. 28-62-57]OZA40673.1 MAG: ethyl tert-butyl ether degradation EthD [Novosphingobium sp. 17-62-9]HQS68165.1 nuclear transport factor 2 family protein [Novosphingobium sp.]
MIKAIALLRKKDGLSREAFIAYYETRHAPLIRSLLPHIADYRRNYVDREGAFTSAVAALDFDSVTEMRFASRAHYDAFLAAAADPHTAALIAQDEENVFDRAATRMFVVDEVPAFAPGADTLAMLMAERAVREGLARFARVLDGKQWDALGDVFAEDVTFDYGLGEQAGMAALTANMRRFLDVCGPSQHLIGSISIDVAPGCNSAKSRAYVQARHQRADDHGGAVFDSNGEYLDQWTLRPEGWRIVRRDAHWHTHSGDAAIIWGNDAGA